MKKLINKFRFTLVELIVTGTIIIGIMILISTIIIVGYLGSEVHKKGLKSSVERVWEGPTTEQQATGDN